MLNPLELIRIVATQRLAKQTLLRTPEQCDADAVMDNLLSVQQYDEAMKSKLAIIYAGALERIHHMRRPNQTGNALDLCCGPGHFTLLLAKYFDFKKVVGVDLSAPMVQAARQNAKKWGLEGRVHFEVGDATAYNADCGAFDLVTCNDAAHHLPDLDGVKKLVAEMDRLSGPGGIVQLTDLVRLKTPDVTQRYTTLIGKDYLERGLDHFQRDFCNSMVAAWTSPEMSSVLPNDTEKLWDHDVQRLLPAVQFITGYPNDGMPKILRHGFPWDHSNHPVPPELRLDWRLFRLLLRS